MVRPSTVLPALALVGLLVLAGCSTGAGPASATTGESPDVDPTTVRERALDAAAGVETYRVEANTTLTRSGASLARTARTESVGVFDRATRRLRVNQTTRSPAGTQRVQTYLVDGTLYQHSPAFVRRYGAEWIKQTVGDAASAWDGLDTLARQRALLNASTVSVTRTATVDGTEAYVLAADTDEAAFGDAARQAGLAGAGNVTDAAATMWVARDSGRLLRSETTLNASATVQGRQVRVDQSLTVEFDYRDVSVGLPEAASTAVNATQAAGGAAMGARESAPVRP
jgi:hypothetical protein